MSEVRPGEIIAGKFQIERVIGEGGMGYVVAARHLQLGQTVALKFMRSDVLNDEHKSRFLREARNTVRLKSKHVSRVLDVGSLEGGAPYIVMEYLEGTDLSALLQKRGPFPVQEACDYIIQACEAIAEAHAHGIVHRDLKPANLFLTRGSGGEPVVKVLDFGVSKVLELGLDDTSNHHLDSVVTKATDLLGSPSYMAPEQVVSARDADSRSDVWSLGVILFRLISGKAPFTGNSLGDLIQNIMHGATPNLRDYRPDIPEGLEHVLLRCMERDRTRRPDVVELARMLAPYAGPNAAPSLERIAILGPALITTAPAPSPSTSSVTGPKSSWAAPQPSNREAQAQKKDVSAASFLIWAVVFSVIVCAIAIAGVKYLRSRVAASNGPPATEAVPSPMPEDPLPPAISIPATPADKTAKGPPSSTGRPSGAHTRPRTPSTTAKSVTTAPTGGTPEPTPTPEPTSEIPPTRD